MFLMSWSTLNPVLANYLNLFYPSWEVILDQVISDIACEYLMQDLTQMWNVLRETKLFFICNNGYNPEASHLCFQFCFLH